MDETQCIDASQACNGTQIARANVKPRSEVRAIGKMKPRSQMRASLDMKPKVAMRAND